MAENVEIPEFNLFAFLAETRTFFGFEVYHGITFLFIFFCLTYIYHKVFLTRKLPLLKLLVVYIILLLGSFLLLVFQVDTNMPIVYSLLVALLLILIVQIRYWIQKWQKNNES